ncbi:hypothetical protein [Streptococcus gallolyticus]|uniref:hypothetical protein n=1 Tax=Streptococcus gallolyticus TaxID=315405 RepID=UPI0022846966|nr:hypothetical protein [Streptococcus gallolyticus]MCY7165730.1 hypothetical protein [Streptococcus gallolyticus subsp. gallolyticus]MCY7182826.1 hypothetical protein [Streptococcus gallolyticus subsp. gallolyticus]
MKIEKDKNFEEERSYLINERNVDENLILELEKEAIKEVERKKQNGKKLKSKKLTEYQLILVYFYDKKSDILYFNNMLKYNAVNHVRGNVIHLFVGGIVLLLGLCSGVITQLKTAIPFGIYVALGGTLFFMVCCYKDLKYSMLDKKSWFDSFFKPYLISLKIMPLIYFLCFIFYLIFQLYIWAVYFEVYGGEGIIVPSSYLYLIYFTITLIKLFLNIMQIDIVLFILTILFPLILGTITDSNWTLAALFINLIYLLISKDIWRLQAGRTEPHLRYNLDDEVIKNNIYRSKVLISVMSIIVYLIFKLLNVVEDFIGGSIYLKIILKLTDTHMPKDVFILTLYSGLDKIIVLMILFLTIIIANSIIGDCVKKKYLDPTVDLIVNSIEKQIYKETETNKTEELTKKLGDWKKASKRNHRKKK